MDTVERIRPWETIGCADGLLFLHPRPRLSLKQFFSFVFSPQSLAVLPPRERPPSPATVVAGGLMPTQKQIAANRLNAQLSTGPRTEQGKAISRMNALKTGIDAVNEAASGESPAALAALSDEYDHEFQPIGLVERLLADILIKDDWLLRRYRFLAADLVNHGVAVAFEAKRGAEFGAGFANNTESFNRLHRHTIDSERSFFAHLGELERRQALRRQHQPEVDSSVTDSPETENPEIGRVSQPSPSPAVIQSADQPAAQNTAQPAARPDPATAPAVTRSPQTVPQTPGPSFGFVPHTSPSRPPRNRGREPLTQDIGR